MLIGATAFAGLFEYKRTHRIASATRPRATRSYAIALVFIAGRFVLGVTGWEALGVEIAQAIFCSGSHCQSCWPTFPSHWEKIRFALGGGTC